MKKCSTSQQPQTTVEQPLNYRQTTVKLPPVGAQCDLSIVTNLIVFEEYVTSRFSVVCWGSDGCRNVVLWVELDDDSILSEQGKKEYNGRKSEQMD